MDDFVHLRSRLPLSKEYQATKAANKSAKGTKVFVVKIGGPNIDAHES
jgi:hypothetical protein